MKFFARFAFLLLMVSGAPALAGQVPPSFADLVEKLTPAVVNISTTQKVKGGNSGMMMEMPDGGELPEEFRDFFEQFNRQHGGRGKRAPRDEQEQEVYSLGSGFIIDADGYIATNNHVINDAEEVSVTLSDDTVLKAKIIGRDPKTDLALLKVEAGRKLPYVRLGDASAARVGDWVIAIGNPYGLGGTVTAGIISARARNINAGPFDDFIQTDAAINRGNSGGPMFNMNGEVIGINTAIFSPSGGSIGIGFAVPMTLAGPVLAQLKSIGHIDRGWLGVRIQQVTDEIADSVGLKKAKGALVMEVTKDGPAEKAGIQVGDIITRFDGKEVKEMRQLPLMVADTAIGKSVLIELWRKGQPQHVQAVLGKLQEQEGADEEQEESDGRPDAGKAYKTREALGMSLAALTPALREKFGIEQSVKGIVVTKVKPGSEAAKRGISVSDVITRIGDKRLESLKDFSEALSEAQKAGHKFVLARLQHGEDALFVTLPLTKEGK
jgi:serine protease Do